MATPHEILNVSPDASIDEIRQAYRDLVKVWHPDRFRGDGRLEQKATERLKEITAAYRALTQSQSSGERRRPEPPPREPSASATTAQSAPTPPPPPAVSPGLGIKFAFVAVLVIVLLLVKAGLESKVPQTVPSTPSRFVPEPQGLPQPLPRVPSPALTRPQSPARERPPTASQLLDQEFSHPPPREHPQQPLPGSGSVRRQIAGEGFALFEINAAQGSHYLVKLVDVASGSTALTVFVRSGDIVEIEVPIGTYEVRYASGKNWYGYKYLFGSDTVYAKAERAFTFELAGDRVRGYTITLYKVRGGNLPTRPIKPEEF